MDMQPATYPLQRETPPHVATILHEDAAQPGSSMTENGPTMNDESRSSSSSGETRPFDTVSASSGPSWPIGRQANPVKKISYKKYTRRPAPFTPEADTGVVAPGQYTHHQKDASSFTFPTDENVGQEETSGFVNQETDPFDLYVVLATSEDAGEAWEAYRGLIHSISEAPSQQDAAYLRRKIPFAYLHRLARLLASTRPHNRALFLRLLAVVNTIRRQGGAVKVWEWNALIDCAGKGWRRTRPEDFSNSLGVYEEMLAHSKRDAASPESTEGAAPAAPAMPDIVTYTTLLNIAARTGDDASLRLATSLLHASAAPPNRITHLTLLAHAGRQRDMPGMRGILQAMRAHAHPLGLDGANACLWAFGRAGLMDTAGAIYRVLQGTADADDRRRLADEGIDIPADMRPDDATYTDWIQLQCYRGDLLPALAVFAEMLESPRPAYAREPGTQRSPTLPVFRALFIGFARHAEQPDDLLSRLASSRERAWTLENLETIFDAFLNLPAGTQPAERTIYNVLVAYAKTSGNDMIKMREVWVRLAERYGGGWRGRLERMRKQLFGDDPESPS